MFNPTQVVIDAFVQELKDSYHKIYGILDPEYPNIIGFCARMALENIANSDAPYHDVHHTILVTQVGQEILRGRHLSRGGVTPRDYLTFTISLLCHDIGYVRGVLRGDVDGRYVTNMDGDTVVLPRGATDASLTPYHIDRGKMFVKERFGHAAIIDAEQIIKNIEYTRFPLPDDREMPDNDDYPALLSAADLIGQLADISYIRKISALFNEFEETGANKALGYKTPADLRAGYPGFFWNLVSPNIGDALRYLRVTQEGKLWIANLYSHIFAEEHNAEGFGPERGEGRLD